MLVPPVNPILVRVLGSGSLRDCCGVRLGTGAEMMLLCVVVCGIVCVGL